MNLLDILFPKTCVGCDKIGVYFCPRCIQDIKQTDLVCPFCERPSIGGVTHPVCQRKYGLDGLWSLGVYQEPLRGAIQKLKYRWIKELARVLAGIVIEYWARYQPYLLEQIKKDQGQNWTVLPVPLYFARQNWRGFNQSALLAELLAKQLGLKYLHILKRTRNTKPQVKLDSDKRRANIKNAFSLNTKYLIHDTNVILVDDVWTTGATLKECCRLLKRGGAKKVWGVTLAR